MKVKKVNPEWQPSENPGLKVGDTLEITDPKSLILNGDVVGVGSKGEELSAYELYGVIVANDLDGFDEFLQEKKARAIKAQLEAESQALEAELAKTQEKEEESATTEVAAKKPSKK